MLHSDLIFAVKRRDFFKCSNLQNMLDFEFWNVKEILIYCFDLYCNTQNYTKKIYTLLYFYTIKYQHLYRNIIYISVLFPKKSFETKCREGSGQTNFNFIIVLKKIGLSLQQSRNQVLFTRLGCHAIRFRKLRRKSVK